MTTRTALDAHTDRAVRLVERLTRTTDRREPSLRDLVEVRLEAETHALRLRLRAYELRIAELLDEVMALEAKVRTYRERYESVSYESVSDVPEWVASRYGLRLIP